MEISLLSFFIAGLLNNFHCFTMCGGIAGALNASLTTNIKQNNSKLLLYSVSYNCGRITSYAIAGGIVGSIGFGLFSISHISEDYLRFISHFLLFLIGLYLTGLFPKLMFIQRIGQPFWRFLEPYGRRLLPVKTIPQAFLFGMIWGWLPCGIVYGILVAAFAAGGTVKGMSVMLAFGLGTLPLVFAAGFFTTWMIKFSRNLLLRRGAGVVIMSFALVSIFLDLQHTHSH